MAWESYNLMKCKKCGKVYEVEESTLIIAQKGYDRCPICNSSGDVVVQQSILDVINEQNEKFKNRKRRTM